MQKPRRLSPGRILVLGFLAVIMVGTVLLMLPVSLEKGVSLSFVDSLFTSTSAVCVTGLAVRDTADTFSVFGEGIVALLIQIGGLGITSISVFATLLVGGRVSAKKRLMIKESYNFSSAKGMVSIVKAVLYVTLVFESVGAVLFYITFCRQYGPVTGAGVSIFHSIASFNNAGFDIFGGFRGMAAYDGNVFMNLVTCGLVIFGGLGFFVIRELIHKRNFSKLSLHAKAVLTTTLFLLLAGTLMLKLTSHVTWLEAFFHSTSARTAGFATLPMGNFSTAGMLVLMILMFIGASSGSTGGGIKTTTAFVMIKAIWGIARNKPCTAFKRTIPRSVVFRAFVLTFLAAGFVIVCTMLLCIFEPDIPFVKILFEVMSGFGTVGLSTGITPYLSGASKIAITVIMFIGRVGPLTVATIWTTRQAPAAVYSEEKVIIG